MKIIAISMALAVLTGCASAESRMQSRADYRDSQVEMVKAQKQAEIQAAQQASAEKVAMWQALSEAVKANPDAASHMAIVAAVASTGGNGGRTVSSQVVTLNRENETNALDVVKAVTPSVVGALTQTGIAAIAAETLRNASDNSREINIERIEADSKMWDVFGDAVNGDDVVSTTDVVDTTDTTDTTDSVDDGLDSTDDVTPVPDTTPAPPAVDCSGPQFSPINPACAES
ncbi:hypothetical protein [uncultured Mediterranean phage uvMED]|nr:hypothetical protein [uncultured Mediterranean phage uvMED]